MNSCIHQESFVNKNIADILQNIIPNDVTWKLKLLRAWPEIVGKLAERVTIFTIEDDRLILQTSHPAWAQELSFLAPLIHEKIDALIGPQIIRAISFKITNRRAAPIGASSSRSAQSLHSRQPTPYAMTTVETAKLEALQDDQLKQVLRDYLLRTKARM